MARAITSIRRLEISEEEQRRRDLEELGTLLIEHKEVIKDFLHMLNKIQDRSGLDVVTGLFDKGDEVLDVLVKATDKPEVAKMIKNSLLLLGSLGKINIEDMNPFIEKINGGLHHAVRSENKETGYGFMLRTLAAPETKEALVFLLSFLKGMGAAAPQPQPVPKKKKGKKSWLVAAGLSLASVILLSKQSSKTESESLEYDVIHHQ
ncbi:DUF1641 domain-containing protein [Domibacillus sp.]|uniref:DUF1641 domain-containing protein n=1 Tax=Domibacillus sp. TaxID=1969783 RepID=UPI0028123668|nr:DUF1641 domain-containing protein [Domibacillus sp.]